MFCTNCGEQINDSAKFCPKCGTSNNSAGTFNSADPVNLVNSTKFANTANNANPANPVDMTNISHTIYNPNNLVGFSPKINDPAFAKYLKNTKRWAGIFALILAVIAIVGFFIAGQNGAGDLKNPQALYYGFAIGGMFILIAFFQTIRKKKDSTWDGQVVDKRIENKKRRRDTSDEDYVMENVTVYTVIIRDNAGKNHPLEVDNNRKYYDYFEIGDFVRHHAGFYIYEKYDKTRDQFIFCIACGNQCDTNQEKCNRCKCPILN